MRNSFCERDDRLDEVLAGYLSAVARGERPDPQQLLDCHPDLAEDLKAFLAEQENFARRVAPLRAVAQAAVCAADVKTTPEQRPIGTKTAGWTIPGYEILEELGRGGMGVVYKARQLNPPRLVAIKMILAGEHADEQELARFKAEAEALAALQHPNIVQVFEVGTYEGRPYFSLEYVAGGSLNKKLNGTPRAARQSAQLIETLARTVHAAHQAGVIHRDLKPANVLIGQEWTLKLTDFGLAKRLGGPSGNTPSGAMIGTPSYMAPEQASGRAKAVGPEADVYALGAILYELLTGRPPFTAATQMEIILQVLANEPVPPQRLNSAVPRDLETICLKCLQKEAGKRYPTAEGLAEDLRRFLHGEPILARPVGAVGRLWRWGRRNPAVASLTGLVATVLVVASIVASSLAVWALGERDRADRSRSDLAETNTQLTQANVKLTDALGRVEVQRNIAISEGTRANENARHALARQLAAQAELLRKQRVDLLPRSVLLAVASLKLDPTVEADQTLRHGLQLLPRLRVRMNHANSLRVYQNQASGSPREYQTGEELLLFDPHGKHLAALSGDGVRVWETASGQEILHIDPLFLALGYDSRGKYLCGAGSRAASLWPADGGKEVHTITYPTGATALALSPEGNRLAVADLKGIVRVWDLPGGMERARFDAGCFIPALTFSRDGNLLAVAESARVGIWDVASARLQRGLDHEQVAQMLAWSPDGRLFATCTCSEVRVWNTADWQPSFRWSLTGKSGGPPQTLAFSPRSHLLAMGGGGGARVWQVSDWKERFRLDRPLRQIGFSHDDRFCAGAGGRGIRIWKTDSWEEVSAIPWLKDRLGDFRDLTFSPDDQTVVVCGVRDIALWSWQGQGNVTVVNEVSTWAFSPTRKEAAALGHFGGGVYRLDDRLSPAGSLGRAGLYDGSVHAVGFSPDGDHVAIRQGEVLHRTGIGPGGKHINESILAKENADSPRVWHLKTRRAVLGRERDSVLAKITFHTTQETVAALPWEKERTIESPGGRYSVTVNDDWARVLEKASGKERVRVRHGGWITAVEFSADGNHLLTAAEDRTARVWSLESGAELVRMVHDDKVTALACSPDSRWVASASADGMAWIWPAEASADVARLPHESAIVSHSFTLSGAADRLVTITTGTQVNGAMIRSGNKPRAHLWDLQRWTKLATLPAPEPVGQLVVSGDGRSVATWDRSSGLRVLELQTGRERAQIQVGPANAHRVNAFFSTDGHYIATSASSFNRTPGRFGVHNLVQVWEVATGRELLSVNPVQAITYMSFSPDNRYVAGASGVFPAKEREVLVWEIASGRLIQRLPHEDGTLGTYFTPDGKHLITWTVSVFRTWNVSSWSEVDRMTAGRRLTGFGFSPDGRYLALATGSRKMRDARFLVSLWEIASGKKPLEVPQEDEVGAIAFTPDGKHFATAYGKLLPEPNDRSVRVWDTMTGQETARLMPPGIVLDLAFSARGRHLLTGGSDGQVRAWSWSPADMIAEARSRLRRNLTPEERARYFPKGSKYEKTYPDLP
jgi:eukaryotic-like serine/threonine-protein kinase